MRFYDRGKCLENMKSLPHLPLNIPSYTRPPKLSLPLLALCLIQLCLSQAPFKQRIGEYNPCEHALIIEKKCLRVLVSLCINTLKLEAWQKVSKCIVNPFLGNLLLYLALHIILSFF